MNVLAKELHRSVHGRIQFKFIPERRIFGEFILGYKNNVQANTEQTLIHGLISFTD